MKILLARCGYAAIRELAEVEDIEIISTSYYDEALKALLKGVDGVITDCQMHRSENKNASPWGEGPASTAWGVALAAKAQELGVPVIVVSDSLKSDEKFEFIEALFKHLGKPVPCTMYVALNKKRQRVVYMELRKRMRRATSKEHGND